MGPRARKPSAIVEVANTGGTVTETDDEEVETPRNEDGEGSSSVHRNLLKVLRTVSQEDMDSFGMTPDPDGVTASPIQKERSVSGALGADAEQPHSFRTRSVAAFWRGHDALEDWGYRNFPVVTDLFNLIVYAVDLAIRSVRWFQFGVVAVFLGFRLIVYAIMLLPGFLKIFFEYYHDQRIQRRIRFGPAEREYLDIYVPKEAWACLKGEGPPVPVVIAIMGGAFIIGHRGYNAQLGLRLMDFGVITVGIDYRNFPRAKIPDMVEDVGRGVRWVFQNIHMYGGDPKNVMLMGQSAGAHLSAMLLLEHGLLEAMERSRNKELEVNGSTDTATPCLTRGGARSGHDIDAWSVTDLKGYIGISGPYDLIKLGPHLASRGLYPKIVDHITNGDAGGCSPERILDTDDFKRHSKALSQLLPHIHLFHGYKDKAVPVWASSDFAAKLTTEGITNVTLDLRKDMTHTYPVIEGPMKRHDPQVELILPVLFGPGAEKRIEESSLPPMFPIWLLNLAGAVSPF